MILQISPVAKPIKVEKDDVGSRMGYTVFNTQSEKDKEIVMKHFRDKD